jgi:hypothetical protein
VAHKITWKINLTNHSFDLYHAGCMPWLITE